MAILSLFLPILEKEPTDMVLFKILIFVSVLIEDFLSIELFDSGLLKQLKE